MYSNLNKIFEFDTKMLRWTEYMDSYYYGIKKYLVREDLTKLDQMRSNYKRYKFIVLNNQKSNRCCFNLCFFYFKECKLPKVWSGTVVWLIRLIISIRRSQHGSIDQENN